MDTNSLRDLLAKLHTQMADALRADPKSMESLNDTMRDLHRLVENSDAASATTGHDSIPARLENIAVQFEADHPTLAASARRLVDLLSEVGI
jgi:hypothetical protein